MVITAARPLTLRGNLQGCEGSDDCVSGFSDGAVVRYDVERLQAVGVVAGERALGHTTQVNGLAMMQSDSRVVVTAGEDGHVRAPTPYPRISNIAVVGYWRLFSKPCTPFMCCTP
eukprot:1179528-Prorocentrum_minimum.AAC.1